ncbi:c-type cytochrome domain-containing protein [Blastopirellula retiformator]|uniref:Planctomycete cytochrome C n=1 Tax=Blastopirellula retiformator TaxID=2527970 RepID=A0A5C5VAH6_9BACT|nr:c-type cytochrome domain-containing protein [Blastopirellula retiformator]TWT34859.1 Planctomycete cytochrome C [Blastopirellula retiformator]
MRLDTYAGMVGGGVLGPAVAPGKLDESLLLTAISYEHQLLQMPPDEKLAYNTGEDVQRYLTALQKLIPKTHSPAARLAGSRT